jgi:hypothetical protein
MFHECGSFLAVAQKEIPLGLADQVGHRIGFADSAERGLYLSDREQVE